MVGEFPELQGVMGRYYAEHDGEPSAVAQAIGEFYQPRFAGDAIPASSAGRCVAFADRLDTLVGIFSVGGAPTGDKDPYALRRAALGSLRLCIEGNAAVDLADGLEAAARASGGEAANVVGAVFDFILERSRGYFTERGIGPDVVEAVLSTRPTQPLDLARRVQAVAQFADRPEARALAAANKRIANILRKAEEDLADASADALCEAEELALAAAVESVERRSEPLLEKGDYAPYLGELASLHTPINAFFEAVLVMAEAPALRRARLALLARIQRMFLRVADVAHLSH
jgi:glycyl-tRNA synthetase beta chain